MIFDQALAALREGKRCARGAWHNGRHLRKGPSTPAIKRRNPWIGVSSDNGPRFWRKWRPTKADRVAIDWEVLRDEAMP